MFVTRNEAKYFLPAKEKHAISSVLLSPWEKLYVQSGKISDKRLVEPHVYSIGSIVVETQSQLLILLDSEELDDGTELFRLAVVADRNELKEMLLKMHPPIEPLDDIPVDLDIESFFGVRNAVSLLRFKGVVGEGANQINTATESGLLVSNSNRRLLLYPNETTPMEICVTTNVEKIDKVLAAVDMMPFD